MRARCVSGGLWSRRLNCYCNRRWGSGDRRTRRGRGTSGSLGDDRARGWAAGNGGRRRRYHDRRCRTWLGNNLARFWTSRCSGRRSGNNCSWRGLCWRRGRCCSLPSGSGLGRRVARCCLFFLFLGQNGLHHIARLGDVREINLGRNALRGARRLCRRLACGTRSALKMRANLIGLILFKRTGVGLSSGQAKLRQHVENLSALDLHLARKIVDSNLTHPPLFTM